MPGSQFCGPHQPKGGEDLSLSVDDSRGVISWMSYIEGELKRLHSRNASSRSEDISTG